MAEAMADRQPEGDYAQAPPWVPGARRPGTTSGHNNMSLGRWKGGDKPPQFRKNAEGA
jgi:hypothetical protein